MANNSNGMPRMPILVPGAVYPYELPQGDVEEPFEPISFFSIRESGRFGPLNEENLKTFLRHKLDRRLICTREVILRYTDNVPGLTMQLTNLRNRINQIKDAEKERNDFIKKRITEFERALKERKPLPNFNPYELKLSNAAIEAFHFTESQGPLKEAEMVHFINTGVFNPQAPLRDLIKQLKDLRLRINDNIDIEKHKLKFPYDRIVKAINDIITEMMIL